MLEGAYKLIVMFFGYTDSPVTFQAIINDLLRVLIETGDVVAFIDDIIVGKEIEKGHNNIVEKILRRMVKNDLFVKHIQRVVKWPIPRGVNDVQKFLKLANYYRQFVKDFSSIAKLFYEITRKDIKWN